MSTPNGLYAITIQTVKRLEQQVASLERDLAVAIQAAEPNARALVYDQLARQYHDDYERGGLLGAIRVGNELLNLALAGPGVEARRRALVLNVQPGCFGLSRTAVLRARELSGDPLWGAPAIAGDPIMREEPATGDNVMDVDTGGGFDLPRDDPVLVQVVRELGAAAASDYSELAIIEIPAEVDFRIHEGDSGCEWVAEAHRTWRYQAPTPVAPCQHLDAIIDRTGPWPVFYCPSCEHAYPVTAAEADACEGPHAMP